MSRLDRFNKDGSINHNFDPDTSVNGDGKIDYGMKWLIRATHWLWYWHRKFLAPTVCEIAAFNESILTMVRLKKDRRTWLIAERKGLYKEARGKF